MPTAKIARDQENYNVPTATCQKYFPQEIVKKNVGQENISSKLL